MGSLDDTRARLIDAFGEAASALETHASTVLNALTQVESRKTATVELDKTIRALRTYEREIPHLVGRGPLGTIAVSLPFNNPLYSLVLYAFGPLLAGNQVHVRPSSLSRSAIPPILEVIADALEDVPLQLTNNNGNDFVAWALGSPEVKALIFTGTWKSAERLVARVTTGHKLIYCGAGMNPFIVTRTADVTKAVAAAIYARLFNSGQDCLAAEVFFVHADVVEHFTSELVAEVKRLRVGPNDDSTTDIGPLLSVDSIDAVDAMLAESRPDRLVIMGESRTSRTLVPPIVLKTTIDDPLVLHEKYAPVFVIVTFTDLGTVRKWVDESPYRLGLTIYGADHSEWPVPHVSRDLCLLHVEEEDAHVPFGGYGRSGFVLEDGQRQGGPLLFSVVTSTSYGE